MTQDIIFSSVAVAWFSLCIVAWALVHLGSQIAKARKARADKHYKTSRQTHPLISVVVIAQNNQDTLIRSLDSIFSSTVRKFEVIVLNNKSADTTAQRAREYAKNQPLAIIQKRKPVSKIDPKELYKHQKITGEILLVMWANHKLEKNTLKLIRENFERNQSLGIIKLKAASTFEPRVHSLIELFNSLTHRPRGQTKSSIQDYPCAINIKTFTSGDYQTQIETRPLVGNINSSSTMVIAGLWRDMLPRVGYGLFSVSVAACIGYGIYRSNALFFLIPWAATTLLYLFMLIGSEKLGITTKFRISFYLPLAYLFTTLFAVLWICRTAETVIKKGRKILFGQFQFQSKLKQIRL